MFNNTNRSSGQTAKLILILAVIVIIAILIAYVVIKRAEKEFQPPREEESTEPLLVYETTLGNVKFLLVKATNKGDVLYGRDSNRPTWQENLHTTERFIEVVVAAQNVGKEDTRRHIWGIGEIIDSEGRKFIPSGDEVSSWLPLYQDNLCGSILKPSFEPSPCKKIYEVAKVSTGLKIKVVLYDEDYSDKIASEALLDIKLTP